jgi:uncharacterized protein YecE (DUF72 family)
MEKKASSSRRSTSKRPPASSPAVSRRTGTRKNASESRNPRIRIGVSGWLYAPWRGHFYPEKLPQRRELEYAAGIFNSIEINGSFYSLQHRESWQRWYAETPDDFVFAVKGGRYITHMLRLRDAESALANFFAQGLFALKHKLGPILWQLPPQMGFEPARIEEFLHALPRDTAAALAMARARDARMDDRDYLEIDAVRPVRHAFEIRHRSFLDERFIALLRAHNAALVLADTAQRWPMAVDVTADFVYLRLHGDKQIYQSGYTPRTLGAWADRIQAWSRGEEPVRLPPDAVRVSAAPADLAPEGRDVFCYFDNTDVKLRAPKDAQRLMHALSLEH